MSTMYQEDLTPKQKASEAIRQAETIFITTGQNPSVDQATATIALATILRKYGKKVSAVISDKLPKQVDFLQVKALEGGVTGGARDFILKVDLAKTEVDKLKYTIEDGKLNIHITPFKGNFAPSDVTFDYGTPQYDLVITLGVPTQARLDRVFEQQKGLLDIPIVNIDFHRSNESYGAINLIEPQASSLNEIILALSESLQSGMVDPDIATVMLAGIISATDRFTAQHTTSKSLTVAAQLMAAGGRQQEVVKGLYRGGRTEPRNESSRPVASSHTQAPKTEPVHTETAMTQDSEIDLPNEGEEAYESFSHKQEA